MLHEFCGLQIARKAQHLQNGAAVHRAARRGALVQKAQSIPQSAVRQPAQKLRAVRCQVDVLLSRHVCQPLGNIRRQDALEGIPLAAGENGGRDLVQLRGGQNEHQVGRGLLQNFQQGVEGGGGEHVHLVHDVYPLFHVGRGVNGLVPQSADLIHAVVGGGVQLQNVQKAAVFNAETAGTLTAGVAVYRVLAVHRLGQNFGAGSLAGAPGAGKEIGVGGAALRHLLFQRLGDVLLSDNVGEHLGPPFAVQRLIHGTHLLKNSLASCGMTA